MTKIGVWFTRVWRAHATQRFSQSFITVLPLLFFSFCTIVSAQLQHKPKNQQTLRSDAAVSEAGARGYGWTVKVRYAELLFVLAITQGPSSAVINKIDYFRHPWSFDIISGCRPLWLRLSAVSAPMRPPTPPRCALEELVLSCVGSPTVWRVVKQRHQLASRQLQPAAHSLWASSSTCRSARLPICSRSPFPPLSATLQASKAGTTAPGAAEACRGHRQLPGVRGQGR